MLKMPRRPFEGVTSMLQVGVASGTVNIIFIQIALVSRGARIAIGRTSQTALVFRSRVVKVRVIDRGYRRIVPNVVRWIYYLVVVVGMGPLVIHSMAALRTHHVHSVSSGESCSILVGVVVTPCGWTGIVVRICIVRSVLGVVMHWGGTCVKMGRCPLTIFFLICFCRFLRLVPIASGPNSGGPLVCVCYVVDLTVRGVVI